MTMKISNCNIIEKGKEELQIKPKYFDNILEELILRAYLLYYIYNVKQCNDIVMIIFLIFLLFSNTLL